eukprot:UN13715
MKDNNYLVIIFVNSQYTQLHFMFEVMVLIMGMKKFYDFYRKNMFTSKIRGGKLGQNSEIWKNKGGELAR